MSWNVGYKSLEDFNSDVRSEYSTKDMTIETIEQLKSCRAAATELIASKSVGVDKDYLINLSGHSNPNHEPASRWVNDCVFISITQKS